MLKRTPVLAFIIAGIMAIAIILIFEKGERPFTIPQVIALYFFSFFPAMGISMLFDPYPAYVKKRYLKINFYIQDEDPAEQVARVISEERGKAD